MNNILITGGGGLLGQHVIPILKSNYNIWSISRSERSDDDSLKWIRCDLSGDLRELEKALPEKIDAVIHLAQSAHFRDFPSQARHIYNVNIASTMFLLEAAANRGCTHFINASSGGVYQAGDKVLDENDIHLQGAQMDLYPASKLCSELLVNSYQSLFNAINLRFFFIYGRGQEHSMLIPRLVNSVREGKQIILAGGNGLRINPVHVTDAASAVARCFDLEDSATINIAGPDTVSLRELASLMGYSLGRAPLFETHPDQPVQDLVANISLMKKLLVTPEMKLAEGIADYCEFSA